ncbi:MAG: formate C-acetyltransferase/glycerol dehydratase family glycyl radical enzyme [Candidatus Nezhaarchaeota archaeon]|nr:formate C-acetyltransferase/glycerol dehydratase family glycyl radical enzyme [Candidatus Nezhaarchaeota archaeon]MCX8141607.1 formate C-acetyltransferase/glycerol dehydratase family glycyl radical enzyme [Candidatus Nezhaarchaeota archaeon]MDW8049874.1 pyruvate formate lyase family protein [Nitrososphaerota archaeon]
MLTRRVELIKVVQLWSFSEKLSKRIKKLRDEYFSFERRPTNEVIAYTTGMPWDEVFSYHDWGVVPEMFPFLPAMRDSLKVLAIKVNLPEDFWKESLPIRRAIFFKKVIEEYLPVRILDGELIVGFHFNTALSKCFTKKEAKRWRKVEERWFRSMVKLSDLGVMNCGAIPGHIIPNYKKVLEKGFKGIRDELLQWMDKHKNKERKDYVRAMIIAVEAVKRFAERYAEEADRLAEKEEDDGRRAELLEIARICRKVPWEPPETFWEALQALWFTHMLVMAAESYPGPGLSYGRLDQYLYPYFKRDIGEGKLTKEFAKELLCCFWIKHNYAYDYMGKIGNQGINSGFGQLITIGGIKEDGSDAVNELTWLILEVTEEMNMLEPKLNIRLHKGISRAFLLRVCQVLARSQGSPFLLNFDEQSMKGLIWEGISENEVWDYACVGCLENTLQGKDRSGTVDVNINLAKPLELVFGMGRDLKTGEMIGVRTKDPKRFKSYEEFEETYFAQLKKCIQITLKLASEADAIRARWEPVPYLSALIEGCAEKGIDVRQGGAVYNFITVEGVGLATVADSLAAVKKLVFEQREVTMEELVEAINRNFEGFDELQRRLLFKAPKFGNDDDYVDLIARKVSRFWTQEVFKYTSPLTKRRFRGGYLSWNYYIDFGPKTAATPDGRPRGRFLSNGVQPVQGMDRKGPTAVVRSVGKLGLETAPNGASLVISLNPSCVRDYEHLEKLAAFLLACCEIGITNLQINMISPEILREAQRRPDEYRNLLVRVTGYNAYFVTLGREQQEEIIARTCHGL